MGSRWLKPAAPPLSFTLEDRKLQQKSLLTTLPPESYSSSQFQVFSTLANS